MESFSTTKYRDGEYADNNIFAGLLQKFCSAWLQECGQDKSRVGEDFLARYGDKEREWAIIFTFAVEQFQGVKGEVTEINIWSVIRKSVNSFSSQPESEQFKTDIFKPNYC